MIRVVKFGLALIAAFALVNLGMNIFQGSTPSLEATQAIAKDSGGGV